MNGFGVKFQSLPAESYSSETSAPSRLLPAGHTFSDQSGDVELATRSAGSSKGAVAAASEADDNDLYTGQTSGSATTKTSTSPYIFMPDTLFRKIWIQVTLVTALYVIWVTPIRVGFDWQSDGFWFFFEGLIDIFFLTDLVLNFFTAYEDKLGNTIVDHKMIAERYLRTWFAVDFLATFPMDYIIRAVEGTFLCAFTGSCAYVIPDDSHVHLLKMLKMLRIFRILWILKHFKKIRISTLLGRFIDDLYKLLPLLSILEILCILLFLGHVSGCFFYFFSSSYWWTSNERELINNGQLTTWVILNFGGERIVEMPVIYDGVAIPFSNDTEWVDRHVRFDPHSNITWECPMKYTMQWCNHTCLQGPHLRCRSFFGAPSRYIAAMYWAYTTMSTVGYGDIAAVTISERVWASIVIIFSGFFFSFTIGRMASVVSRLDADRQARDEKIEVVGMFLADTGLPKGLGKRVLEFFKKQKVRGYDWQEVINALPFELKTKILRHLYASAIKSIPLLNREADDDIFLTDICIRLQPYNSSADTYVYQRGESGGDVFILLRGEMSALDADLETVLYRIPPGTLFGEGSVLRQMEGFSKAKRTENVLCKSACEMFRIAMEDVVDLLEQYPSLHTTFKKVARLHQKTMLEKRGRVVDDEARAMHPSHSYPGALSRFAPAPPPTPPADPVPGPPSEDPMSLPTTSPRGPPEALVDLLEGAGSGGVAAAAQLTANHVAAVTQLPTDYAAVAAHLPANFAAVAAAAAAEQSAAHEEEVRRLRGMVRELQRMLSEELQHQRAAINQIPGRLMNHLVMVIGQPSEEQMERATAVAEDLATTSRR